MTVMNPKRVVRGAATVVATGTAFLLVGSAAYAFWSGSGTGSGTSKALTLQGVTVAVGTAPPGELYPGLTANGTSSGGDINVVVTNANPFPVTLTLTSIGTVTGCTTPGVTLGSGLPTAATQMSVAANATSAAKTWSNVLSMSTAADNTCQGATLSVPVNFSVTSN